MEGHTLEWKMWGSCLALMHVLPVSGILDITPVWKSAAFLKLKGEEKLEEHWNIPFFKK